MARPASAEAGLLRGPLDARPRRHGARSFRFSALHAAAALAVAAALASVAITLIHLPELLAAVYRFSDAPEASFVAQALATGHGPAIRPTQTSIAIIWFDQLLRWVPLGIRMGVEYWTGPILGLLAGVLAVRTAYLVAGRRAALWLALLLAVLPPVVLWPLLFPDNHGTTYLGAALLAWHLVHDLRDGPRLRRSIVVGVLSGVFAVSDPQLVVFGLGPWLAAVFLARRGLSHDQARSALVTAGAALGAVGLTLLAMARQGVSSVEIVPGASAAATRDSIATALKMAGWIVGGGWFGDALPLRSLVLCALVAGALAALALAGRALRARARDATQERLRTGDGNAERLAFRGYRAFWACAGIGLLAVFVLAGYGGGGDPLRAHYLLGCYFALAGVVASSAAVRHTSVRAPRLAQLLAAAALVVFSLYAANTAARTTSFNATQYNLGFQEPQATDPLPVLVAHGLHRGYAGYWEAYDLDWRSGGQLSVWPLLAGSNACGGGAAGLCPYRLAPQGEYADAGGPTFVITPLIGGGCSASAPAVAIYGPPRAVYTVGPYTISVYGYDVASRFAKTTRLFC